MFRWNILKINIELKDKPWRSLIHLRELQIQHVKMDPTCYDGSDSSEWVLTVVEIERRSWVSARWILSNYSRLDFKLEFWIKIFSFFFESSTNCVKMHIMCPNFMWNYQYVLWYLGDNQHNTNISFLCIFKGR